MFVVTFLTQSEEWYSCTQIQMLYQALLKQVSSWLLAYEGGNTTRTTACDINGWVAKTK